MGVTKGKTRIEGSVDNGITFVLAFLMGVI